MKRSDALSPLSHDHHEGLAFAARLRRAHRDGETPASWAGAVGAFWREHLVPHFEDEEAFVLPVLEGGAPALAAQMAEEHRAIRALVQGVETTTPSWDGPLGAVAAALSDHIRFEEREAFPAAERLAREPELGRLGAALHHARATRQSHSTPPAPRTP